MTRGSRWSALLVAAHLAALWPVARWYVDRVVERGAEPWGLIAVGAAAALLFRSGPALRDAPLRLFVPLLLLAAYVALRPVAPPLIASAIGVLSLVSLLGEVRLGRRLDPALAGLALLSLPDISTLQVFVGWPIRHAVAAVVAPLLAALGVDADQQGTLLVLDGSAIAVDAPCSGVWMGWGALLAWFTVALAVRLRGRPTLVGVALVLPLVFLANVVRTASLTLAEARLDVPAWAHEGVGVVVFAAVAAAIVALSERLAGPGRRTACAARFST